MNNILVFLGEQRLYRFKTNAVIDLFRQFVDCDWHTKKSNGVVINIK